MIAVKRKYNEDRDQDRDGRRDNVVFLQKPLPPWKTEMSVGDESYLRPTGMTIIQVKLLLYSNKYSLVKNLYQFAS